MPLNNPDRSTYITTGGYTGDDAIDRAIPHGLGQVPALVIFRSGSGSLFSARLSQANIGTLQVTSPTAPINQATVAAMTNTNFHVGDAANLEATMNALAQTVAWMAVYMRAA